jgi:ribose-phosphate pyrophosphokinase
MDLHASQIQGFFDIPVDHLFSSPTLARHFLKMDIPNLVVVSPDVGSIKIARAFAKWLGAGLALVDKRRPKPNSVEVVNVIGDVRGKNIVIRDDMIDTGGTLIQAVDALRREGALNIYAACTHPLFSGGASENVANSELENLIVTDTVTLPEHSYNEKIYVVSVAEVFGEAIRRIHFEQSVSSLFY